MVQQGNNGYSEAKYVFAYRQLTRLSTHTRQSFCAAVVDHAIKHVKGDSEWHSFCWPKGRMRDTVPRVPRVLY